MKIRFIALVVLLYFAYHEVIKFLDKNQENLNKDNIKAKIEIQSGDIIFRKENNMLSDMFSKIDKAPFSHIGIVLNVDGEMQIYHMEADDEKEDLKVQTIVEFTQFSQKIAVYRHKSLIDEKKLSEILEDYKNQKIKFDYMFELNNDTLYCTEFINEIFVKLFDENIYSYLYDFYGREGISINGILNSEKLEKRFEIEF